MVAAAQGDAFLVGHGHDIVRVDALEVEADDATAVVRRAEDAEAGHLGLQPGVGEGGEFFVVLRDGLAAEVVEIVHGAGESDDVGDVGGAGLELGRDGGPFAFKILDAGYHAAAAAIGRHRVEQGLAAVEQADTGRAAHLVAGDGEEVATHRPHIERQVAGALRGIDDGERADFFGRGAEFRGGIDDTEGVGDVDERENLHVGREHLVQLGQVEQAAVPGDDGQVA